MKRFVKHGIIFIIPFIFLYVISYLVLNFTLKAKLEEFRFDNNINKLIVGDSRVKSVINDSIIENTRNISQVSQSFIYSFYEIVCLTENNPKIDTIFLGASFHSFSDYYDEMTFNHSVMGTYFYTLPKKVQYELLKQVNNPLGFLLKSYFKWSKNLINTDGMHVMLGGVLRFFTDVSISESSVSKRIRTQYFRSGQLRDFSILNINYFNKIVEYCKGNGIKLIILNTPMHYYYKEKVPDKFEDCFYSIIKDNQLEIIEFDGINLKDTDFLPDGDHLSALGEGYILVSEYLQEYLKSNNIHKVTD